MCLSFAGPLVSQWAIRTTQLPSVEPFPLPDCFGLDESLTRWHLLPLSHLIQGSLQLMGSSLKS